MAKELPYIDDQGQLHYEAYFGKGRAFLRTALPTNHPEHLYNYLKKNGIDWTLYFEEDGRRKGIDHEHGPVEKLLGLDKKVTRLHTPLDEVFGMMPGKERVEYTRSDMERAFAAGGANAAKERVSDNKLTLPVLDFDQWLKKYKAEKFGLSEQARGRMERKGQGAKIEIIDMTTNSEVVKELFKGKMVINNINKPYFLHEILAEVVMLPTDKPSHLYAIEKGGKTTLYFEEYPNKNVNAGNQHLYFTSNYSDNEKPQTGDWIYIDTIIRVGEGATEHPTLKGIFQIEKVAEDGDVIVRLKDSFAFELSNFKGKKIIATTDPTTTTYGLPQPKVAFLSVYIGAYNNGHPVKEVSIEAELLCCQTGAPCGYPCNGDCEKNAVKVPLVEKDNTINIAPIK